MVSEGPGRGNGEDDNGTCEGSSESEYTGSAELQEPWGPPTGSALTRLQQSNVTPEPGIHTPSTTHFEQTLTSLDIPQDTGSLSCDMNWTGATGQAQTDQALPTPLSDYFSGFDPFEPFEVSTPNIAGSQPWCWTKGPMDERDSHNAEPFDIGCLDLPGSSDHSKDKAHSDGSDENTAWENAKKGSITLTLSQVDSVVAQEIMGSVLKHSASLKIRCIVNDE